MWYCRECGQQNEGKFCSKCGAEFYDPIAEANGLKNDADRYSFQRPEPPKKKNKGLIIGIIVAAAVVLLGILGVVGFFAFWGNDAEEPDGTGIYYYVSAEDGHSYLYEEANIQSQVMATLQNGSALELIDEENDIFYYVTDHNSGLSGYMRQDELVSSPDDVISEDEDEDDPGVDIIGLYYVTNTKTYLSLLDGPSSDANRITKLYNGYMLGLIEKTSDSYWQVYDYNSGETGYVLNSYLTDNESNVKAGVETVEKAPASTKIVGDYYVTGTKNYLAIRSQPSSSSNVEIGKTYNGNLVGLIEKTNGTFWYVYDYSSGLYGYVKCAYLSVNAPAVSTQPSTSAPSLADDEYLVSGTKHYLAIRSEPSSAEEVEIGKTYNGNTVQVLEKTNGTFWYVYDYSSGLTGYVKCAYLTK